MIGYGEGYEGSWDLSFTNFCKTYDLAPKKVAHCLALFDQASIFHQIQHPKLEAKVQFLCTPAQFKHELEQGTNIQSAVLQRIARKYPGVFEYELSIDLDTIVQHNQLKFSHLLAILAHYKEQGILSFQYNQSDIRLIGLAP